MCVSSKTSPRIQVAKEDIVCYKHIKKYNSTENNSIEYYSTIYKFCYLLNKQYSSVLSLFVRVKRYNYYASGKGFYSWPSKDSMPYINARCIIPENSKYYLVYDFIEKTWVYISDKIKIIEIL